MFQFRWINHVRFISHCLLKPGGGTVMEHTQFKSNSIRIDREETILPVPATFTAYGTCSLAFEQPHRPQRSLIEALANRCSSRMMEYLLHIDKFPAGDLSDFN